MDNSEHAARVFKALGDPTRLEILKFLAKCDSPVVVGSDGTARKVSGFSIGEVCCQISGIDRPSSTMSHHIRELERAGLIDVRKEGRHRICSVNPNAVVALRTYVASLAELF